MGPFDNLMDNPIALAAIALLIGLVVVSVVKKLLKIAFVLVVGLGAIAGYFAYTGQPQPEGIKKIEDAAKKTAKAGTEAAIEKLTKDKDDGEQSPSATDDGSEE